MNRMVPVTVTLDIRKIIQPDSVRRSNVQLTPMSLMDPVTVIADIVKTTVQVNVRR